MSTAIANIDALLAGRLRKERLERNWSMQDLANRAGVSKAMIGRMEQGEVSPTAHLLSKIANAFELTLSTLLARSESDQGEYLARDDQPVWVDPQTRYIRRSVSAAGAKGPDLAEVVLPPRTEVHFDEQSCALSSQQILVLDGGLVFEGPQKSFVLAAGDWLQVPDAGPRTFVNRKSEPCRYLLVSL